MTPPVAPAKQPDGGAVPVRDGGSPTTSPDGGTVVSAESTLTRDPAASIPATSLAGAVTANNAFAVDLFAQVRKTAPPGNLLTSPISASLALTMTYAGAAGETATQMATALHYGSAASSIFDGQNALSAALASRAASALAADQDIATRGGAAAPSPSDYQLQVVNSVWGEKTYPWAKPYLDVLAKSYGTGVFLEDFEHQWEPARLAINAWVSDETADKIQDLLPPMSLDDTTRLVLVNAIHLKLPWANAFSPLQTAPATFTTTAGTTVSPDFMHLQSTFAYVDDGQAQIVALPLAGGALTVLVALPHGDLATYEAALAAGSGALTVPAKSSQVALSLPKFNFTSPSFSLSDALKAMNMTDAFDKSLADFTPMCPNPPDRARLYVSDVLQKAMLAVQETGVEAAAATAVIIAGTDFVEAPPIPMVVNRPFVVSIVDAPTGALLFLGHIEDPSVAGSP